MNKFIDGHYRQLLAKANYITSDEEKGEELLHDMIDYLLEGKATIDFTRDRGILYFMQKIMSSLYYRQRKHRQRSFENGYRVEQDPVTKHWSSVSIREELSPTTTGKLVCDPIADKVFYYMEADVVKRAMSMLKPREQAVLDVFLSEGTFAEFNKHPYNVNREKVYSRDGFIKLRRRAMARLKVQIQVLLRGDSSGDQG